MCSVFFVRSRARGGGLQGLLPSHVAANVVGVWGRQRLPPIIAALLKKHKSHRILYCSVFQTKNTQKQWLDYSVVCKHFAHVNDQVVIEDMDLNVDKDGVVSVTLDVRPYKRHQRRCPHCGKRCPGYDSGTSLPRLWRAPDCGGIPVYLRYAPGRICCPDHGVVTSAVPRAFHGSGFTKQFDLQVARPAKYLPRSNIEKLMRIDWKTVGRCVQRAQLHLDPDADKRRLEGLVNIGVDETSYRKGHKYMTVVVNHDTGEVVWVHENHGKSVFGKFFEALTEEQRTSFRCISGDGARRIDECIAKYVPHATRCVDPFHVVQWAGDALDTMRTQIRQALRVEARGIEKQIKSNSDPLETGRLKTEQQARELQAKNIKHSAYTPGKGKENLTAFQTQKLALIAESQPALYRAYQLKEQLRIILKMPADQGRYFLKKRYRRASHSRSQVIKDLARKIKRHQENSFNTIENGLSNARIKAINNKIKLPVRRAYGFRNLQNMFACVKLICSNVDIPLPNRPVER